jgi:hypothetical protein
LKITGGARNALGRCLRSLTISAVIVRMTPTIPLAMPAISLQKTSMPIVLENPNPRFATTLIASPRSIAGLRPYRSDSRPHNILVSICPIGNAATRRPVSREMCWDALGCSGSAIVDFTRKYRYGIRQALERGVERRHSATKSSCFLCGRFCHVASSLSSS